MDEATTALVEGARGVLDRNWTGTHTRPSHDLYPHQWSWDSCFHALAYANVDSGRAMTELQSLFAGQWRDGRVPHIVFHEGGDYMPGADWWDPSRHPDAPEHVATSSIVQPPVHATAVFNTWFHGRRDDPEAAQEFLEDMFPRLERWHDFLHRERDPYGEGLLYIRHPWESGRDNSPLWDRVYDDWYLDPDAVPEYERRDVAHVRAEDRPSDEDYDRFMFLVDLDRRLDHHEARIREVTPFLVQDALFNAVMVRADHDLGRIAKALGRDDWQRFEDRSWRITNTMNRELWNDAHNYYASRNHRTGERMDLMSAGGFAPLYANIPSKGRAVRICGQLDTNSFCPRGAEDCWAVPTFDRQNPGYSAERYWRGPVWLNLNWFLYDGLMRYGLTDYAARIRHAIIELPKRGGFAEYFDPETGSGHGTPAFSMTAAVVVNTALEQRDEQGRILGTAAT